MAEGSSVLDWQECAGLGWENNPSLSRTGYQQNRSSFSCVGVGCSGRQAGKTSATDITLLFTSAPGLEGSSGGSWSSTLLKAGEISAHCSETCWGLDVSTVDFKTSCLPWCRLQDSHHYSMWFPYRGEQKIIYTTDLCHSNSPKWRCECQRLMHGHNSAGCPAFQET